MAVPEPTIVGCSQWGAMPALHPAATAGKPDKTILHHTAGYAGNDNGAYCRILQRDMMFRRGWADSGHNFIVFRDGSIYEGRHGSLEAIRAGRMILSAHCPGENDQPGVEHEHVRGGMTKEQFAASVALHAWIADRCQIPVDQLYQPHSKFYGTACPADLAQQVDELRKAVAARIDQYTKKPWPVPVPKWFWSWARWRRGGAVGPRPAGVPYRIPAWAWIRLQRMRGK